MPPSASPCLRNLRVFKPKKPKAPRQARKVSPNIDTLAGKTAKSPTNIDTLPAKIANLLSVVLRVLGVLRMFRERTNDEEGGRHEHDNLAGKSRFSETEPDNLAEKPHVQTKKHDNLPAKPQKSHPRAIRLTFAHNTNMIRAIILLPPLLLAACTQSKNPESPMQINEKIHHLLTQPPPKNWRPTPLTRENYLDTMQRIVTLAATWQNDEGAIIDPVEKSEWAQTSPRFAAPAAILLHAGRIPELREKVYKSMDYATARLAAGKAESPDFWMRELITAYNALQDAPPQRRKQWEQNIRNVDPEKTYRFVSNDPEKIQAFHNWVIYAAAGEAMRQAANLAPLQNEPQVTCGQKFFDKYMPAQLQHFSNLGMYRDPGDPFTYDFTTRLQLTNAFSTGFQSPLKNQFEQLLNQAALTQLLYVSPDGYAPFGGRSSQFQLQEAILAAISEQQATHYKTTNPKLASAFKRMAHLHAQSIQRWINMDPPRHIKNAFPHEAKHGIDPYGKVSVYSLFTASCLGLAYQYADDSIPEAPAPAETGGYVLTLQPAFHKIFASCQGTYLEIDTNADPHYDATGLGRLTAKNCPLELALASPTTNTPNYLLPKNLIPKQPQAIAPTWQDQNNQWHNLAALGQADNLTSKIDIERESPTEVRFQLTWQHHQTTITQHYTLTKNQLTIETQIPTAKQIAMTIPLIQTDGQSTSTLHSTKSALTLTYQDAKYTITLPTDATTAITPAAATRNGLYETLTLTRPTNTITTTLTLKPP